MNINRKLLSIGFKKCKPFKPVKSTWVTSERKFMPTEIVTLSKEECDGLNKWKKFFKLKYDNKTIIFIEAYKDFLENLYIENENIKDHNITFTYIKSIPIYFNQRVLKEIKSKSDIINLLPKSIQRDLIINELLK